MEELPVLQKELCRGPEVHESDTGCHSDLKAKSLIMRTWEGQTRWRARRENDEEGEVAGLQGPPGTQENTSSKTTSLL